MGWHGCPHDLLAASPSRSVDIWDQCMLLMFHVTLNPKPVRMEGLDALS